MYWVYILASVALLGLLQQSETSDLTLLLHLCVFCAAAAHVHRLLVVHCARTVPSGLYVCAGVISPAHIRPLAQHPREH